MIDGLDSLANIDMDGINHVMRNITHSLRDSKLGKPVALAIMVAIPTATAYGFIRLMERYDSQINRVADGVGRGIDSINDAAINLKRYLKDRYQAHSRTEK